MTHTLLTALFLTLLSQTAWAGNQLICKMNEIVVCALQKCPVEKANSPSKVEIVVNLDTGQLTRTDDYRGAIIYSDCRIVDSDIRMPVNHPNILGTAHYRCKNDSGLINISENYDKTSVEFEDAFSSLTMKISVGACQKNFDWDLN
ncbi:hypothetical protein N8860_04525 [Alphaproteobacteria bacterium]|nr:hypothetical protein [Alphaproteobacteria bacterium]